MVTRGPIGITPMQDTESVLIVDSWPDCFAGKQHLLDIEFLRHRQFYLFHSSKYYTLCKLSTYSNGF